MYENFGLYMEGGWHPAASRATYPTINPATEETIGAAPAAAAADAEAAIASAAKGLKVWRAIHPFERAKALRKIAGLIEARTDAIAKMIAVEVGKPLAQAKREVGGCVEQFEWYAEEAKRIYGEILPSR